jgi:hypothetical protein
MRASDSSRRFATATLASTAKMMQMPPTIAQTALVPTATDRLKTTGGVDRLNPYNRAVQVMCVYEAPEKQLLEQDTYEDPSRDAEEVKERGKEDRVAVHGSKVVQDERDDHANCLCEQQRHAQARGPPAERRRRDKSAANHDS